MANQPEEIPGLAKYLPDKPLKHLCKECGTELTPAEANEYPAGYCDACAL